MHIYVVSRLFGKTPAAWEGTLQQLEKARPVMLAQYAPLRNAVVGELRHTGSGQAILDRGLSGMAATRSQLTIARKSQEAFEDCCGLLKPVVRRVLADYLRPDYAPTPVAFAGELLSGRFHATVEDTGGDARHLYIQAASWSDDETKAFRELLAILAEERHGSPRSAVWFVDLGRGEISRLPAAYKRLRSDLEKTVKLMARFTRATQAEFS